MQLAKAVLGDNEKRHLQILESIRDGVPECIFVGDSTQLIYSGNMIFNTASPHQWFNSSVGFGTLGYALPAATGAALAVHRKTPKGQPVVCLIGDGGIQFVLGELGACKDADVPIAVVVWCNGGYRELKTSMERAKVTSVGVEFAVPDFVAVARAYGIDALRVDNEQQLCNAINQSFKKRTAVLIAVDEEQMLKTTK